MAQPPQQASFPEDAALFSRPQLYGGFGGGQFRLRGEGKAFFERSQRQRMNIVSMFQCLLLPWLFFCVIYAITSSWIHYRRPLLCYGLIGIGVLVVLASGGLAFLALLRKFRQSEDREPNWFMFLFLSMCISLIMGVILGNLNFWTYLQPYYDYINLNQYAEVHPARMRGQQLMDAGRVQFTNDTVLDVRRSMGFKNLDTYCVAPITVKSDGGMPMPLDTYDFWAVGLGCCSGNTADFHCGHSQNSNAHEGLRLLRDEQRSFYRLAVQQAEATHSLKASHPLFFYWAEDAGDEIDAFRDQAYKYYLIGMMLHFSWQLFIVGLAALGFSKIGQTA